MRVESITITGWKECMNAARFTRHLPPLDKEPSEDFKRQMLLSEHSPLRLVTCTAILRDVPYYVHTHLVRHHEGVQWYVGTSRPDITGEARKRSEMSQTDPVDIIMVANAQALISISRQRLCHHADPETRNAWETVCDAISIEDYIIGEYLKPNCVYRGICPEGEDGCGLYDRLKDNNQLNNTIV